MTQALVSTIVCAPEGCTGEADEEKTENRSLHALSCTGTCGDCEGAIIDMPPVDQMRSLEDVITFTNTHIVRRIAKEQKLSLEEAQQLFKDMLVFLYICAANRTGFRYSPPALIDEAWHTFIIYTEAYSRFCQKSFGFYLHHRPFTESEEVEKPTTGTLAIIIPEATKRIGTLSHFWFDKLAA